MPTCQLGPCCEPCQRQQQPLLGPQHASESCTEWCIAPAEWGSGVYTCPPSAAHALHTTLNVNAYVWTKFTMCGSNWVNMMCMCCMSFHHASAAIGSKWWACSSNLFTTLLQQLWQNGACVSGVRKCCYTYIHTRNQAPIHRLFFEWTVFCIYLHTVYMHVHMQCMQSMQGRMYATLCTLQ